MDFEPRSGVCMKPAPQTGIQFQSARPLCPRQWRIQRLERLKRLAYCRGLRPVRTHPCVDGNTFADSNALGYSRVHYLN